MLGVFYLVLAVWGYDLLAFLGRYTKMAYFVILTVLFLTIEFLIAGSNGIWLISMPLVATAATDLPPWPRRLIYLAALAGMSLPIYVASGDWQIALFAGLTFSPAIVFVIVFVTITQKAEMAQKQAESLAGQLAEANERLSSSPSWSLLRISSLSAWRAASSRATGHRDDLGARPDIFMIC